MRGTTLQSSKLVKEGWEVLQAPELHPAAPGEDHGEAAVPLRPMEGRGVAEIHLQLVKNSTAEQVHT